MKTVLITGCSSGFGLAAAKRFADAGWRVLATMRRVEDSAALAALAGVQLARLDVTDVASIRAAVAQAQQQLGGIDVLVNNAGYALPGVFEGITRAQMAQQFAVNLFGVMDVMREVLPLMRSQCRGCIVNVSSGAGIYGLPGMSAYNASKFALEGFSEAMAYELQSVGIAMKIVEPGGVTSTRFAAHSASAAADGQPPADYAPFIAASQALFARMARERSDGNASAEQVAEVIFQAATDRSERLRYIATDNIKPLAAQRREAGEDAYMAFIRAQMAPELPVC
ncbi:SDR family oxidoreductase [Oleiagrimonas sp. C23AA]|uniref:SDR family oxidoreductase n=1 Tax=Oleiagrimonas sp. C23AA TaxID=2719047 RepID=UPI00197D35F7|nr:SDR family oxidoreductase [Oleiagrimonas sp. C23AA]